MDDKRACLDKLLADPEWSQWSSRVLALKCGLSKNTVIRHREPGKRLGADGKIRRPRKRKGVDGKTYKIQERTGVADQADKIPESKKAHPPSPKGTSDNSPLIPRVSVRMSPDVRQALRLAIAHEQRTQYRIVEDALKEYLIKRSYLDGDGNLIVRKPGE